MITGLNQEVAILGRTIHFQSEVTDHDGLALRFEVFTGGKVVASRVFKLDDLQRDDLQGIRTRMKELHRRTVRSFKERILAFHERRAEEREEPPRLEPELENGSLGAAEGAGGSGAVAPVAENNVAGALRTRRIFGRFRERVEPVMPIPRDIDERLVRAEAAFAEMFESRHFADLRVDEQMQGHLLKERIEAWHTGDRDPRDAAEIWRQIVLFNDYLAEVNYRAELIEFDRRLLIWSIEALIHHRENGVFETLEALYGRHPQIDRMLAEPGATSAGMWVAHLKSVLRQIDTLDDGGPPQQHSRQAGGESGHDRNKEKDRMNQIDELCKGLVEDAPDAIAANVVDLATGMMLGGHFLSNFTSDHFEAVSAAATSLYRGRETLRVEELVKSQRGDDSDAHFMEEVQFSTRHLHHFIALIPGKNAILCLVTKKPGNLGMGWSAVRSRLAKATPLVPS